MGQFLWTLLNEHISLPKMRSLSVVFYILFIVFLNACTTKKIIRNSEYQYSEAAFGSGDPAKALEHFPKKEQHGFVTSIEKSWLGFWNDEKDFSDLMKQSKTFDERKYTSILRETEYFFYNESEDGYIPAEHEVIIMHLLNAMFFMRDNQWDKAHVEARKATFFFQNYFTEDQAHFDDPALRIWLAGVWAALGEWQEAQVDFRKAYELTKEPSLLPFVEMEQPPKELSLIFNGTGPELIWEDGSPTPNFVNKNSPPKNPVTFSSLPWFIRHEKRNSQIRDIIMKSNYMAQYYGLNTSVGAEKSVGFVAANSLRAVGIITGVVVIGGGIYLIAQSGGSGGDAIGYVIGFGALLFDAFWTEGDKIAKRFEESTAERKKEGLEKLRTYRFVRFLPSWVSISIAPEPLAFDGKAIPLQAPSSKTKVLFTQNF